MARKYSRLSWGRNYRALPPAVEQKLTRFNGQAVVVGCVKQLAAEDFVQGRYAHLGIMDQDDLPRESCSFIPSPNVGPTSYRNAVMEEVPRKSIGKVAKTVRGTAPSRGTWKRHKTKRVMQVWPRDMHFPAMSHLTLQARRVTGGGEKTVLQFQVEEVLDPRNGDFRENLLRCLNLLLENAGAADVFPLTASEADRLRISYETIGWELLAPGEGEHFAHTVLRRLGRSSEKLKKHVIDRLAVIDELKPERRFQGGGHFTSYLAAQFTKDLIVFENLDLGALYVMRTDWESLSKLSRSELLATQQGRFERIVHQPGWEERLRRIVRHARGENENPGVDLL